MAYKSLSRKSSVAALLLTGIMIILQVIQYFQVKHQLISPLIPANTIRTVSRPHVLMAGTLLVALIVAYVFHRKEKYRIALFLCVLALLVVNYFPEIFF